MVEVLTATMIVECMLALCVYVRNNGPQKER